MTLPFTDDDLKWLKSSGENFGWRHIASCNNFDLKGLIARLEAAEHVINAQNSIEDPRVIFALEKAWRKAAGKR